MKTQHLCLEDGILEFMDDKIIITDKGRSLKFSKSVIFITALIYSIATAIRGFREHDKGFFIFGILLSSFWIFVFIEETLKRIQSTEVFDNQIEIKDIIVITFQKKRFGADMKGKITLGNNRYREIRCSQNNLADSKFEDILSQHGITVSIE